jgi:hypothetical protein
MLVSAKVAPLECPYSTACLLQPSPSFGLWTLAIGMTVILTVIDICCCAAIGLAASGITHHSGFAAAIAILLRFSPLIVFMAFGYNDGNFWEWWSAPGFALVDGGTAPAVQLIMPLLPTWAHFNPLLGLLLITIVLIGLLLIVVNVSLLILRLNGGSVSNKLRLLGNRQVVVVHDTTG